MGQRLPDSSDLLVLNIATAFGVPPGLQQRLKISSVSSDDSLNLYSKDFVLIRAFYIMIGEGEDCISLVV